MNGFMKNHYRIGLDVPGLILFFMIMAPNLIWFVHPAPVDVLRQPSATPHLDQIASIVQAVFVAALCLLKSDRAGRLPAALWGGIAVCTVGYFAAWGCFFGGLVHPALLIAMCVLPCLSLLLYAAGRRNWVAGAFGLVFGVLHTAYGICNFLP